MKSKSLCLAVACVIAGAAGVASAAEKPTPLPDQKDLAANAMRRCPSSMEHFLPADYYFCEAGRYFWSGRESSARAALQDAAAWASKPAQYALGVMYFNGDHAQKNRPLGLAWLGLAVERHNPEYEAAFKDAFAHVTPAELAQANAYWTEMKKTYGDAVAAPRAERRFNRSYNDLAYAINFGGSIFIDGIGGQQMSDGQAIEDASAGSTGFAIARTLQSRKAAVLAGWRESVVVGDPRYVPIDEAVARDPAPAAQ